MYQAGRTEVGESDVAVAELRAEVVPVGEPPAGRLSLGPSADEQEDDRRRR